MKGKLLNAHLNVLKFSSHCLIVALSLMTFATILALCTHRFSFNLVILQTSKELNVITKILLPPQQLPSVSNEISSLSENNFGPKGYLVKSNEMHGIVSDEELMRKASLVQEMEKIVPKHVPKIAFLFMIKGSLPLAPLWEKFFKGHEGLYSIYVHSDATAYNYSPKLETGVFRGRMIPSKEVEWAKFSMVEAELRLIANALLDTSNQRFVLLSESCIPLFNFPTIYSYLMNSTQTFIETYDLRGHTGRGRYKDGLGPNITIQQWRKGSQWFEMDRDLAIKVISDQGYFNLFKRVCESSSSSCCADEHYFPTWVNVFYGPTNSNRSLTWTDWSNGLAHPTKYRRMDITVGLLKRLRSNQTCLYNGNSTDICYLFARKFAPGTLGRLLRLAPNVMKF